MHKSTNFLQEKNTIFFRPRSQRQIRRAWLRRIRRRTSKRSRPSWELCPPLNKDRSWPSINHPISGPRCHSRVSRSWMWTTSGPRSRCRQQPQPRRWTLMTIIKVWNLHISRNYILIRVQGYKHLSLRQLSAVYQGQRIVSISKIYFSSLFAAPSPYFTNPSSKSRSIGLTKKIEAELNTTRPESMTQNCPPDTKPLPGKPKSSVQFSQDWKRLNKEQRADYLMQIKGEFSSE